MRRVATSLLVLGALVGCRGSESVAVAPTPDRSRGREAAAPVGPAGPELDASVTLRRIAFGSCLDQDKPQPIFGPIVAYDPQVFLLIGDNVYADAVDVGRLHEAYGQLGASEGYRKLRAATPVLATWDDHDYGTNDVGGEYELKSQSQQVMLDFFGEPADSERRRTPGIYDAKTIGPEGERVQIILLDTRYFRSELYRVAPSTYRDNDDPDATLLGAAQWAWLEQRLREPAELRLLVSSIQLAANDHPYERWGVLPRERERLLRLIGETRAGGVIVLSGDRHRGELSRLEGTAAGYPIYDLTSSSLNRPSPDHEENSLRIGELITVVNFGALDIVWEGQQHVVLQLLDDRGATLLRHPVALDELQPK